ncbi:MAG: DUF3373 domain-containing protein [Firmicutes bacterium]|nr:DUF3373 domain-containing protein [Bacillota bacterium]
MRYRVECNYGSKYFKTAAEAFDYFYMCKVRGYAVEIWTVVYCYIEKIGRYGAAQELLDYSRSKFPKH